MNLDIEELVKLKQQDEENAIKSENRHHVE